MAKDFSSDFNGQCVNRIHCRHVKLTLYSGPVSIQLVQVLLHVVQNSVLFNNSCVELDETSAEVGCGPFLKCVKAQFNALQLGNLSEIGRERNQGP